MLKYISIILSFTLIISCKTKQITSNYNVLKEPVIILKKTPCYGECPVYTISFFEDGSMLLKGEHFIERIGNYSNKISINELDELIQKFISADFFNFEDEYSSNIPDFPTTYITFNYKGKTKKIKDHSAAPEALKSLENSVHNYIKLDSWEKNEEEINDNR